MSERTTAEIVADIRCRVKPHSETYPDFCDECLMVEAADRLERPRFTADQLRAVAEAFWLRKMEGDLYPLDAETEILQQRVVEQMRAALSAIGEVDDA